MKKLLLALLLPLFIVAAQAGEFKLPKDKPLITATFPSDWKVKYDEGGLDITSADEEIYIYMDAHDNASIDAAIKDTIDYLKKEKVTIDKSTEKKSEGKLNGMDVADFSWSGKDKDGACNVSLALIAPTKDKLILLLYWVTPEGEKKNAAALKAILGSIKPAA
jgi:hypothetical protein